LVNFLDYMASRYIGAPGTGYLGGAVLVLFMGLAYALRKEYWKDVH